MQFTSPSPLGAESLTPIVAALQPLTADLLSLYASAKLAHWNVRGPAFEPLHDRFGELADAVAGYADDVAERVAQLGDLAIGTPRQVVAAARLPEYPAATVDGLQHCAALADAIAEAVRLVDAARDVADDGGDPDTYDILTDVSRGLQKWGWKVGAHVQGG